MAKRDECVRQHNCLQKSYIFIHISYLFSLLLSSFYAVPRLSNCVGGARVERAVRLKQHRCWEVNGVSRYIYIQQIYAHFCITTHIFAIRMALAAISRRSKSTGEVWMGGAAVWLTAAAVPSRELVDPNASGCDGDG